MTPEQYTALKEAVDNLVTNWGTKAFGSFADRMYRALEPVGYGGLGLANDETVLRLARLLLLVEDVARAKEVMFSTHASVCAKFYNSLDALLDFHRQVTGG